MVVRELFFRNLASQLVKHGAVTTSLSRALELRKVADKLVTVAKEVGLKLYIKS